MNVLSSKNNVKSNERTSLLTVATSMCAALYAIGAYLTGFIPSPWGFGQFRPAVIVPSLFAIIFGPMPAAVGAAIGTLIADSVKHGYLYPGSLLAAVPGNFVGFYLLGYIVKKKFTWERFVVASNVGLTIGNIIIAFLYVFAFKWLYAGALPNLTFETLTFISIGLTIWFFVTELPFILLVTPLLILATAAAAPSIMPLDLRTHSLREELPKTTFSLAMLIPGILMIIMGLAATYTQMGSLMSLNSDTLTAIQTLFYGSGVILSILGIITYTRRKFLWLSASQKSPETNDK